MASVYEEGRKARIDNKSQSDNPYICGVTKLGNLRFAEGGQDWLAGFMSAQPSRIVSKKEIDAAASVDPSRFRRKSNRYYGL